MSLSITIAYFKNNIAELKTPKLSLGSDILIGSSGSQSSISDFIENKTKSVGTLLRLSMSRISFYRELIKSIGNVQLTTDDLNYSINGKTNYLRRYLYHTNW